MASDPVFRNEIISGEDHENSLVCASRDSHLATKRNNAANIKQLLKYQHHYRQITAAQAELFENDFLILFEIRKKGSL